MQKCKLCKRGAPQHMLHELNLKFDFCTSCAPWLPQSYFDAPQKIIKGTTAQKFLKDEKIFRKFWNKIYHKVYARMDEQFVDILFGRTSSEQEMDEYHRNIDKVDSKLNMFHDTTTLQGHTVYWTLVTRKGS